MRKLLPILVFLWSFHVLAQTSEPVIDTASPPPVAQKFTAADISVDSDSVTKVAFPAKFQKKYSDDEFEYEPKSAEKNAWERFKEWLILMISKIFQISSKSGAFDVLGLVLKILAVLVIIFVIYLIVKAILNKEGQWIFGRNSAKKIIRYEDVEKNLHTTDFEKLIKETLASGENRLAIRYYYLWLLKQLSERGYIEWDTEKTNSDYLYEIQNETRRQEFAYLSYLYNNIWYGEFPVDETAFDKSKKAFEKTIYAIR